MQRPHVDAGVPGMPDLFLALGQCGPLTRTIPILANVWSAGDADLPREKQPACQGHQ